MPRARADPILRASVDDARFTLDRHPSCTGCRAEEAHRICQLQKTNIENLYEFEKKQADDEHKVQSLSPAAPTSKAWP